jgi:hypothetical protein
LVLTTVGRFVVRGGFGNQPIQIDAGTPTDTLRIVAGGLVGIGKVPTTKLDVDGVITGIGLNIVGSGSFSGNIASFGTISAPFVTVSTELFMNGSDAVLANSNKILGEDSGAVRRDLAYIDGVDVAHFGDAALPATLHVDTNLSLQVQIAAGGPGQIWHEFNMGHLSGLDADTVDGVHGTDLLNWTSGTYFEINMGVISGNKNFQSEHGFGVTPRMYHAFLKCITTDRDWEVDDIIAYQDTGANSGMTVFANDTFVGAIINASPNMLKKESDFDDGSVDFSDWELILRAWK